MFAARRVTENNNEALVSISLASIFLGCLPRTIRCRIGYLALWFQVTNSSHFMKEIFLLIPILVVMNGCAATSPTVPSSPWAQWIKYPNVTFYVHTSPRVNLYTGHIFVMELIDIKEGALEFESVQHRSIVMEQEYDCTTDKIRLNYVVLYPKSMGEGKRGKTYPRKSDDWQAVTPGSIRGGLPERSLYGKPA